MPWSVRIKSFGLIRVLSRCARSLRLPRSCKVLWKVGEVPENNSLCIQNREFGARGISHL